MEVQAQQQYQGSVMVATWLAAASVMTMTCKQHIELGAKPCRCEHTTCRTRALYDLTRHTAASVLIIDRVLQAHQVGGEPKEVLAQQPCSTRAL
jgi:hypothetical protein